MPQIFRRSANTLSKVSIFGLLSLGGGLVCWQSCSRDSSYVTGSSSSSSSRSVSHMHHVTDDGIDCRLLSYVGRDVVVRGNPPTKTCMNCHAVLFANATFLEPVRASSGTTARCTGSASTIFRLRLLNHSIHTKKGVGCGLAFVVSL